MTKPATNRQKKVLRFFDIEFHPAISTGAAGWEIGTILSNDKNAEKWRRYLYLTKDFDTESDELLPFTQSDLRDIVVPEDGYAGGAVDAFQEEIVAQILSSESPYDDPAPFVMFSRHVFCFTGKFDFGPRKACVALINEKGGIPAKRVSAGLDYLVIGTQGSPVWKRGNYGNKIQKAILLRRSHGKPAIVSEDHCFSFI